MCVWGSSTRFPQGVGLVHVGPVGGKRGSTDVTPSGLVGEGKVCEGRSFGMTDDSVVGRGRGKYFVETVRGVGRGVPGGTPGVLLGRPSTDVLDGLGTPFVVPIPTCLRV